LLKISAFGSFPCLPLPLTLIFDLPMISNQIERALCKDCDKTYIKNA